METDIGVCGHGMDVRVVAVPRLHAEALRRELHALGLVDRRVRMEKRGDRVLIPVTGDPPLDLSRYGAEIVDVSDLSPRPVARNPREELAARLEALGVPPQAVPRRWERIGDVIVVRLPEPAQRYRRVIAEAMGTLLRAKTVAEDVSGIHGPLRTPEVRVLWGNGTETVHVEGGVRYKLDVAKVMFSSGNLQERLAVPRLVREGGVVVDLFAGIGYFALPIAVHARPRAVHACELNPVAFHYLVENLRINRVSSVIPRLGDCRKTSPEGVADLVLMGHFEAARYLDVAFRALRDRGTLVYHGLCPKERFPQSVLEEVSAGAQEASFQVEEARARVVKSYAPGIVHAVVEAHVARQVGA